MKLNNKIILVTGGAKRIGAAISRYLALSGAHVIIHYYHSDEEANNLFHEISQHKRSCELVKANLSDITGLRNMVNTIYERHKRIDALICNAALFPHTPFFEVREEEWDQVISVNLKGNFFLNQLVGRKMVEQGKGRIIIISDVSAEHPWVGYLPYTISKAGLNHLIKGLAKVLAPNVLVNGIAPGTILPPDGATQDQLDLYLEQTLLKRIGDPQDIVKTVAFLLKDSDFITGAIIPVDGGYQINRK